MPPSSPDLALTPFVAVGVLGIVAAALVWWQRRGTGVRADDVIRLIATRGLGAKRLLAVVDVEGARFLLGLTDESVTCLGRLDGAREDERRTGDDRDHGNERPGRSEGAPANAHETSPRPLPRSASAPPHDGGGIDGGRVWTRLAGIVGVPQASPSPTAQAGSDVAAIGPAIRVLGLTVIATLLAITIATPAHAALPQLSFELGGNSDGLSTSIQLMVLFTLLSFAPAILIGISAFVRIVIVLAFVRQAVGTQQMPPNQVIVALALFLTFFVMMPTLREVNEQAVQPYLQESAPPVEALEKGFQPLRAFMLRQTREKDLALFLGISQHARPDTPADVPPEVVIPAFMISELKTAFQISFMVYVPFLVLDMVVASILTSMGMITLPPVLISLPFKLMIFVLVDGWNLLISSLVRSFQ